VFERVDDLRGGIWSFVMVIRGDDATIFEEECLAEIFGKRTNIVQFTEGGVGCICAFGCQPSAD
jgi:hypothetical protein